MLHGDFVLTKIVRRSKICIYAFPRQQQNRWLRQNIHPKPSQKNSLLYHISWNADLAFYEQWSERLNSTNSTQFATSS